MMDMCAWNPRQTTKQHLEHVCLRSYRRAVGNNGHVESLLGGTKGHCKTVDRRGVEKMVEALHKEKLWSMYYEFQRRIRSFFQIVSRKSMLYCLAERS